MSKTYKSGSQAICIIGVGNEYRSDDGVGLLVARKLKKANIPGTTVLELSGEGGGLMESWEGANVVVIVDAVSSGAPLGTTYCFDARSEAIPSGFFHYSTHAFSVAESIELAKILGKMPERCLLYGIEGRNFGMGTGVAPALRKAADKIVAEIRRNIASLVAPEVLSV
ncbi:MAG TPA: hydrogenase maturation protease [Bacteroidota bacterium]